MKNSRKLVLLLSLLLMGTGLFAQNWYVCAGSFSNNENAKELVLELKEKNIPSFIFVFKKTNGKKLYRVLIDKPYTCRDEARDYRDELEVCSVFDSLGISGLWICQAEKPECFESKTTPVEQKTTVTEPKEEKTVLTEIKEVKIVLTWNNQELDLDSSMKASNVTIDFENKEENGIKLDLDEDADYSPETITISNLNNAEVYKYFVEDYDNYYQEQSTALSNSGATVNVFINGENKGVFEIQPGEEGFVWHVFDIENGEIILINEVANGSLYL